MSCFNQGSGSGSLQMSMEQSRTNTNKRLGRVSASLRRPVSIILPDEDLGATKRRLVCIRRQSDNAAVHLQVGFKLRTGWQPFGVNRKNQDSLALMLPLPDPLAEYSIFGVFDGHGTAGHKASSYVAENVVLQFKTIMGADKTVPAEVALWRACVRTNKALLAQKAFDVSMTGTTAAVAVVHGRRLICANVGDSRIVVGTVRKGTIVPLPLTTDHVPSHPVERRRIEAAGGRVEKWTPAGLDTGPPRLWLKHKRLPGLLTSRVFGDLIVKHIASSDPEMTSHLLVEEDQFVVLATDGIWGQMSNEQVVEFVAAHRHLPCQKIAEALVKHATMLWCEMGGESIDDISVILLLLNW